MFRCSRAVHAGKVGRSRLSRLTGPRFCSTLASWGHVIRIASTTLVHPSLPLSYDDFSTDFFLRPSDPPPQLSDAPADSVRKRTTCAPANQVDWITNGGRHIRVTADSGPSDLSPFFLQKLSNTNPPELQSSHLVLLQFGKTNGGVSSHLMFCDRSS